jgi:glycosyltransferase involved in cell wall biosynthesis
VAYPPPHGSERRITVAITTLNLPSPGGVYNHIVSLCRRLDRRRFRVVILYWSPDPNVDLARALAGVDVEVRRLPRLWSKPGLFIPAFFTLWREFRRLQVDVVYSIFTYTDLVAAPAARLAGARVVSSIRGRLVAENNPAWERLSFRLLHPVAQRLIRRFVAVSATTVAEAHAHLGVDPGRCVVVNNGLAVDESVAPPPLPASDTIGVLSRLQYEKGIDVLLRSVPRVLAALPGARFVIAGDGPDRAELERLAVGLGVASAVEFRGWCTDPKAVLRDLALVAIPSYREGVPWTLLEAMGEARPVVASKVGGIPEIASDGETAVLVPAGDESALGTAIVELLRDRPRLQRLGEAGRRRVVERFTETAAIARIEGVLDEAAVAR